MFKLTPEFVESAKRGNLLTVPPPGSQELKVRGTGDAAVKTWREIAKIEDFELNDEDGKQTLRIQYRIPADVMSVNQGRVFSAFFRFPEVAAQEGDEKAIKSCEINGRELSELLDAAGYDFTTTHPTGIKLSEIPFSQLVNQRVSVQVKESHSDDYGTQNNFGRYKAA